VRRGGVRMFVLLVGDVRCWWWQRWWMVVGKRRIAGRVVRLIVTASCSIMNDV